MIKTTISRNIIYVDGSNLLYEGQRVSAVSRGWAIDLLAASKADIRDFDYRLDLRKLFHFIGGGADGTLPPVLFASSASPTGINLEMKARAAGFAVEMLERKPGRREKGLDTWLTYKLSLDTAAPTPATTVTLVAGDGDYLLVVQDLIERGIPVEVMFWSHACRDLQKVASKFTPLDSWVEYLRYERYSRAA